MIEFTEEICGDLSAASRREWLETNGIGGFASSTLTGLNTRRYHGLLVAATRPPVGRLLLLSKLEETLVVGGRRFDLSANQYPGAIHPRGFAYLKRFRLDPFPVFTYGVEGFEIEKSIFMIHGENSSVVQYEARSLEGARLTCALEVRPLVAFRDYHGTTHENGALDPRVEVEEGRASFAPYRDLPALHFAHDAEEIRPEGFWYRSFEYEAERERGLDFKEDLFNPFALTFDLSRKPRAAIIASTEPRDAAAAGSYRMTELGRRERLQSAPPGGELARALVSASDQFIVARGDHKTVIAGYHWFTDWGRDTMIALPGLTLATGRFDVAKSILLEFARHLDQGMLPNRYPDAGEAPEYNTVDATLWFFEAVRSLADYSRDYEFIRRNLYEAMAESIDWHVRGTRFGIRVDEDALLASGAEGAQLTWMDAKVGDYVVTPRRGKPVEIQALWYNALRVMEGFARRFGEAGRERLFGRMARRAKRSFNKKFWNEDEGCLYDVVGGGAPAPSADPSVRPNQIFAVSLPHAMLSRDKARRVVETVERDLLTPFGLRSLSPADAQYIGRYEGDPWRRDVSYHQGTVWSWLMGPFITAYIKVNSANEPGRARARARAEGWVAAFREHLFDAGLNQVSEIFDGDAPHEPRGCIAQAWSVAELLRATFEDIYELKPAGRSSAAGA
ncbi:MAG TPA: amylo-alpha-1,6-glucosidase [Blastocatellia bacterium]|nr:amylo-alpha-1,6-glucosidase [Blastocatellia bacterium]